MALDIVAEIVLATDDEAGLSKGSFVILRPQDLVALEDGGIPLIRGATFPSLR